MEAKKSPQKKKSPKKSPGKRLTAALERIPQPEEDTIALAMEAGGVTEARAGRAERVAKLTQGVADLAEVAEDKGPEAGSEEAPGEAAAEPMPTTPYVAPVAPWHRSKPAAAEQLPARPHFATLLEEAQNDSDAQLAQRLSAPPAAVAAPQPEEDLLRPNPLVVAALVDMGFGANCCKRAAIATGNEDVQAALEWVFVNMDLPGVDEPFGDEPAAPAATDPEPEPHPQAAAECAEPAAAADTSVSSDDWVEVEVEAEAPSPLALKLPMCPGGWMALGDEEVARPQQPQQPETSAASSEPSADAAATAAARLLKIQEEEDAALARTLSTEQSVHASTDASLAAALQLEMELEHDENIRQREVLENRRQGGYGRPLDGESRIRVDMSRHYIRGPRDPNHHLNTAEPEVGSPQYHGDGEYVAMEDMGMVWDEASGFYRDANGEIVTKHNAVVAGHKNAQKLQDLSDAVGAELGDLSGAKLPNAAYNTLRKELVGMETRAAKRGGKKEGTDKKDRVKMDGVDGVEYGVEHSGKGEFMGLRIVSDGAARNAGIQGW